MSLLRTASDRSGQDSIRALIVAQDAPLWKADAPDIAPTSSGEAVSPVFFAVIRVLAGLRLSGQPYRQQAGVGRHSARDWLQRQRQRQAAQKLFCGSCSRTPEIRTPTQFNDIPGGEHQTGAMKCHESSVESEENSTATGISVHFFCCSGSVDEFGRV